MKYHHLVHSTGMQRLYSLDRGSESVTSAMAHWYKRGHLLNFVFLHACSGPEQARRVTLTVENRNDTLTW